MSCLRLYQLHSKMDQETRPDSNLGTFGCALVAMGSISAIAGVAALLGISPVRSDIEVEFWVDIGVGFLLVVFGGFLLGRASVKR